jgi:hypothetical protein
MDVYVVGEARETVGIKENFENTNVATFLRR